jgi:hypothetical protein
VGSGERLADCPLSTSDVQMNEMTDEQKQKCATCFMWRVALFSTAIVLLVSWLAAKY